MEPGKKNDKNAMIKAYKERNAELNKRNHELTGTVAALIKQRDEAIELARKRGEEVEELRAKVKKLERSGNAEVREVALPKEAVAAVRVVSRPTNEERKSKLQPGQQVQAAVAHFLRDFEFEVLEPRAVAWDRAYKINGVLLNGEPRFSLDEIMAAVGWLGYSLGEKRYSVAKTRKYLESLVRAEEGDLLRAAQCELELLKLAQESALAMKTDVGREAVTA